MADRLGAAWQRSAADAPPVSSARWQPSLATVCGRHCRIKWWITGRFSVSDVHSRCVWWVYGPCWRRCSCCHLSPTVMFFTLPGMVEYQILLNLPETPACIHNLLSLENWIYIFTPSTTFKHSTFRLIQLLCQQPHVNQDAPNTVWVWFLNRCAKRVHDFMAAAPPGEILQNCSFHVEPWCGFTWCSPKNQLFS